VVPASTGGKRRGQEDLRSAPDVSTMAQAPMQAKLVR